MGNFDRKVKQVYREFLWNRMVMQKLFRVCRIRC